MELKEGQEVEIFNRLIDGTPIFEGSGKLVKLIKDDEFFPLWIVKFRPDYIKVQRKIIKDPIERKKIFIEIRVGA